MEITVTVKLTEGMVYDAMKEAVQEFFTNLPSQENRTGLLKHSLWSQILRNDKPVTDSDIEPLKDNSLGEETKYSVILYRGTKEIGTIQM